MIMKKNADQLALWLADNQPEVFAAMLYKATRRTAPKQLGGLAETLSSFGASLGSAVKSVGSFIKSEDGMKTLGTVGGLYLQSQAQRDALRLQTQMVQSGYAPYPVQNVGVNTNSAVPVYGPTGQVLNPSLMNQLMPRSDIVRDYLPWGIGIAFALALLYVSRPN